MIKDLKTLKELIELIKQDVITANCIQAEIKLEILNKCVDLMIEKQESILE
jgi:hypothetical protein